MGNLKKDGELYDLIVTDQNSVEVFFIDFDFEKEIKSAMYENVESGEESTFVMPLDIHKRRIDLYPDLLILKNEDSISRFLNNKFIEEALKLGEKNRLESNQFVVKDEDKMKEVEDNIKKSQDEKMSYIKENKFELAAKTISNEKYFLQEKEKLIESKFDIDIEKYIEEIKDESLENKNLKIKRRIMAKLNNLSAIIATEGRIGPGQFLVTDKETYDYLLPIFEEFEIKNLKLYYNDKVKEGKILIGRKNAIEQPCIAVIVRGDSMNDISNYGDNCPIVQLIYAVCPIGLRPEKQFYTINFKK